MSTKVREFGQLLLEAIDDGLSVLGEEPRSAFYQFLATMHSLPREDIPKRVEEFSNGLKKALGGAYPVVQRIILRKLFQKLGSSFHESPGLELVDYVSEAKQRFEIFAQRQSMEEHATEYQRSKKSEMAG